jgi:hypothetical protein
VSSDAGGGRLTESMTRQDVSARFPHLPIADQCTEPREIDSPSQAENRRNDKTFVFRRPHSFLDPAYIRQPEIVWQKSSDDAVPSAFSGRQPQFANQGVPGRSDGEQAQKADDRSSASLIALLDPRTTSSTVSHRSTSLSHRQRPNHSAAIRMHLNRGTDQD